MKVNIAGSEYTVSIAPLRSRRAGQELWGRVRYGDRTIELNETLPNEIEARKTFIHELVHAMQNEIDMKQAEKTVERFSVLLYDTLERNGFLVLPTFLGEVEVPQPPLPLDKQEPLLEAIHPQVLDSPIP